MKNKSILSALLVSSFLVGCSSTWDVEALRSMEAKGSIFEKQLKHEYTELAAYKEAKGDWAESELFLERAAAAAEGRSFDLEQVGDRNLAEQYIKEVTEARERLLIALNDDAKEKTPSVAAKAQVGYECWTSELDDDPQTEEDVKNCREKLSNALDTLERDSYSAKTVSVEGKYVIYFDWDSHKLVGDYRNVFNQAIEDIKKLNPKKVVVSGHTDTSGPDAYNLGLSKLRAEAVKIALGKTSDVEEKDLGVESYGESKLAVETKDNVRESKNRRVEISFE